MQKISVCVKVEFGKNTVNKAPAGPEYFVLKNGSSAHDLLKVARQKDPCFDFTLKKTSWGYWLDSMCGVHTDLKLKKYWMIYVAEDSVKAAKFALYGIVDLKPAHGSCVIFKYMNLSWG